MPSIRVFASIDDAEQTWRQIESEGFALPYQTFDWIDVWFRTLGQASGQVPCPVVVLDDDGSLLALFPLGVRRRGHLRVLSWLGAELGDQLAPVLAGRGLAFSTSAFEPIWRDVLDAVPSFDLLSLRRQPATVYGYRNPIVHSGMEDDGHSHLATLQPDWETFSTSRSSARSRKTERRHLRRLEEEGTVRCEVVEDDESLTEAIGVMIEQKRRRYAETNWRDMFEDDGYERFYRLMTQRRGSAARVQMMVMRVDDEIAATDWSVRSHDTLHSLVTTFSDRFSKQSPGTLLTLHVLQWCFEHDLEAFDFSSGDEAYKKKWCDVSIPLHRSVVAGSWRGQASLLRGRAVAVRTRVRALLDRGEADVDGMGRQAQAG